MDETENGGNALCILSFVYNKYFSSAIKSYFFFNAYLVTLRLVR